MPNGYAELGALLGGGRDNGSKAYADQQRRNALAADAMFQARQERAKAMAREGLAEAVRGVYTDPAQAALVGAVLGSASTPNLGNLSTFEDPAARALYAERQAAFDAGDFKRMNAVTAVLGDKQYEPLELGAGGKAVFDPVLGDATLTPLGEAEVDATNALTQQRVVSGEAATTRANAAAGREAAHADLYRRTDPNRPRNTGGHGKPKAGTLGDAAPATRAWSAAEVQQAISDARKAISTGRITREAAQKRLLDAGLGHAAGVL